MPTRLCRWGNSIGLRLDRYIVNQAQLQAGDYCDVVINSSNEIVVRVLKPRNAPSGYAVANPGESAGRIHEPTTEEILGKW